jgi:hypothetical protein
MKREELQQAIELPAQKLEVQLEEQLTQRILDDVGQEPGNLPLLEFALTRLWEKQKNRTLTHAAYQEIGGVKKAIANHAEQVYQKLSETQKQQAQRIFVQLVRPGEGTEDTRRVATRAEVGEENWNLVSYLAGYQARLVVTGRQETEDTVEVVHEALIREWLTLREWMNANRQFRTWQERLKLALREWKTNNQDVGGLLRGASLTVAEDWLQKRADEMTQEERNFIQVSAKERDREKREIERRRRLTMMGLSGFSVIALGLSAMAGVGWWRVTMTQISSLAQSSEVLLQANEVKALETSLKALIQMRRISLVDAQTQTQVKLSLVSTLSRVTGFNVLGGSHSGAVNTVIFSPDGKQLVTASHDKTVKVWDFSTGKLLNTLSGHSERVSTVIFSPDGKQLVTASDDKTVKVWEFSTGKLLKTLSGHSDSVTTVIFSPDGKQLVTASSYDMVRLWRLDLDSDDLVKEGCKFWGNYLPSNPNDEQAQEIERELCSKLSKR